MYDEQLRAGGRGVAVDERDRNLEEELDPAVACYRGTLDSTTAGASGLPIILINRILSSLF